MIKNKGKSINNAKSWLIFVFFVLIFLFFVIATFFDLQISKSLSTLKPFQYTSENIFAIFIELFGESILYLICALALSIIYLNINYRPKVGKAQIYKKIYLTTIFFLITFVYLFGFLRIHNALSYLLNIDFLFIIYINYVIFSLLLTYFSIYLLKMIKKETIYNLLRFAIFVLVVAVLSTLITQVLKIFVFERIRFKGLNYIGDFSFYAPWYILNSEIPINQSIFENIPIDCFRSFPSGHVVSCSISFCFFFLPMVLKSLNTRLGFFLCYVCPIVLTSLVAFGRVIAGAHYTTDVLFSMMLVLSLVVLFSRIILNKRMPQKETINYKTSFK